MVDIFDGAFKIKDNNGNVAEVDENGKLKMAISYDLTGAVQIVYTSTTLPDASSVEEGTLGIVYTA